VADNFGLKIGIEGEKEFKNAIREINQSFKVLGSEMNLVASQFDKQDKSVEAVTARNKVLNKEIELQKEKIATLEKALANAASSFGETDKRTQSWQIQLNNAKAELNKMERELEANNKALDNAGKEFDEAEKQADEFGREIKKAADQADDAGGRFEKLGGVLKGIGVAMGAAIAAIGTAAVGAGKALVDMSVNSAAYADEILTASTVTGMSTDSLQAYKYAAELVDVSLDTLTGSMARNVRSMSSARKGTGEVADAYRRLGVSVTDASGNLRDSETVYWETIDALGKVSNETERDALAMQIFGKSAQELNPLIAQGSVGIAELTEEAKRMGAVMSEDSLNALGKFDDSIQRLKAGSVAAKNMLGTVLLPQLQILADDGVALIGEFTRGLSEANGDWTKISEVIGNTMGSLVSMMMENLPNLIQVGLDIVTSIGLAYLITGEMSVVFIMLGVTTLGIAFSLLKKVNSTPQAYKIGEYLIFVFSFALALTIDITTIIRMPSIYFVYTALIMFGSIILHFVLAKVFNIDRDTAIITSTAGIYGPAFIPPVVSALKNDEVLITGLSSGLVGYAIGNYLGFFIAAFIKLLVS
jgi:methyl-accepting chemotaxis protein